MLAYHFVPSEYALQNLQRRRLKLALIEDLNDPFELLGADLREKEARRLFSETRRTLARRYGILCFSRSWRSPLMWSHYASKHAGVCLGFEVPKDKIGKIHYDARRIVDVVSKIRTETIEVKEALMKRLLFTKYEEWKYERELRVYVDLNDKDQDSGHYFADFGKDLRLRSVIFGPRFSSSHQPFVDAARDAEPGTEVVWSRLAFKSYSVVPKKGRRVVV